MKKVLLTILLLGFGIWGCSENSNIVTPENNETEQSFLKVVNNNYSRLMKINTAETITGEDGGKVLIDFESPDGLFSAKGKIKFKKNSFVGPADISVALSFDSEGEVIAALDFGPSSIELLKPALLTIKFKGIEFSENETDDDYDFFYIDISGKLAPVEYKKIVINKKKNWVKIVKAELEHFSRYGFTK